MRKPGRSFYARRIAPPGRVMGSAVLTASPHYLLKELYPRSADPLRDRLDCRAGRYFRLCHRAFGPRGDWFVDVRSARNNCFQLRITPGRRWRIAGAYEKGRAIGGPLQCDPEPGSETRSHVVPIHQIVQEIGQISGRLLPGGRCNKLCSHTSQPKRGLAEAKRVHAVFGLGDLEAAVLVLDEPCPARTELVSMRRRRTLP